MRVVGSRSVPCPIAGGSRVVHELDDGSFVVTSAIPHPLDTGTPETYVFRSNSEGEILSWEELPGSFRGDMDHDKAIEGFLAEMT